MWALEVTELVESKFLLYFCRINLAQDKTFLCVPTTFPFIRALKKSLKRPDRTSQSEIEETRQRLCALTGDNVYTTLIRGGGQNGKSKETRIIRLSRTPKSNPRKNFCSKSLSTMGAKLVVFQPFTV